MGATGRILAVCALAAVWGCFSAPSADVLFSCDPDDAPACPPDYACESDGCCHREGSDVQANLGACSPGASAGAPSTGASSTSGSTDTGSTDTDTAGTSSSSGTGSSSGTSSAGTSSSDSSSAGT